jgi:hypothetical protein
MMSGDIVTKTKNIRVGTRPVPADGFYEWKKVLGGKIPYSIGMKDKDSVFNRRSDKSSKRSEGVPAFDLPLFSLGFLINSCLFQI